MPPVPDPTTSPGEKIILSSTTNAPPHTGELEVGTTTTGQPDPAPPSDALLPVKTLLSSTANVPNDPKTTSSSDAQPPVETPLPSATNTNILVSPSEITATLRLTIYHTSEVTRTIGNTITEAQTNMVTMTNDKTVTETSKYPASLVVLLADLWCGLGLSCCCYFSYF